MALFGHQASKLTQLTKPSDDLPQFFAGQQLLQSTGRALGQGGVWHDLFRSLAAFHLQRPGYGTDASKVSSLQPGRGVLQSVGMAAEQRLWEDWVLTFQPFEAKSLQIGFWLSKILLMFS